MCLMAGVFHHCQASPLSLLGEHCDSWHHTWKQQYYYNWHSTFLQSDILTAQELKKWNIYSRKSLNFVKSLEGCSINMHVGTLLVWFYKTCTSFSQKPLLLWISEAVSCCVFGITQEPIELPILLPVYFAHGPNIYGCCEAPTVDH